MKRILLLMLLPVPLFLGSCGGAEEETENNTEESDTTAVEDTEEEEMAEIAFDGVEKDGYVLYGHTEIDAAGAVTTEEMMKSWETDENWKGKVQVNINEVCKKMGCWITFLDHEDAEVRVYFKDHFGIPTETAQGTEAVLYGSPFSDTLSVEMQKHLMEDALEEGEELDEKAVADLEPKLITSFDCESILIKQ
ncbi:MAG: DUF4920 domain-containing protein [Crocinitomicaceae bacterium]|nr:DUF4920 domain-containing protein [Crocinitomicaceae bacterium]